MLKRVFHFRSDYNRQLCFMSCRLDNYESERNFIVMFLLIRYMEPLVYGDYPSSMRCLVKDRLPTFTKEEKNLVKGSLDFIGINYYTSRYAKSLPADSHAPHEYSNDYLANIRGELIQYHM